MKKREKKLFFLILNPIFPKWTKINVQIRKMESRIEKKSEKNDLDHNALISIYKFFIL
jgi:hypothetical protein